MNKKEENLQRLESFKDLEQDWVLGANSISIEAIERGKELITILDIQPNVYPTAEEGVVLEYEIHFGEDRIYLDIEVDADKYGYFFMKIIDEKEEIEENTIIDRGELLEEIKPLLHYFEEKENG